MDIEKIIEMKIHLTSVDLKGIFFPANKSNKLVIFAHGSGSSRFSPRNITVAKYLADKGISAFLFDLLTEEEDVIYQNRFEIKMISNRLIEVTKWIEKQRKFKNMKMGYFGASTGAAAALRAAMKITEIKAVVSRGGRPDLAILDLPKIKTPTLLIVGEKDDVVVKLNKQALTELGGIKKIEIIAGATHLFEEPGKLEEVARVATDWFDEYLK